MNQKQLLEILKQAGESENANARIHMAALSLVSKWDDLRMVSSKEECLA